MKKIVAIMLAAACAFSLAACSEKANDTETATAAETTEDADAVSAEAAAAAIDIDAVNDIIANLDLTLPENYGSVKTLGNYKGIEVTSREAAVITDETAMDYIETYVLPNFTEEADVIEDGDTANINYEGKKDGVAFDGGTAEGYDLVIGSGSFIDGFESGLIGVKKGETVDLDLTFPENYGSTELAGQDVVFTVTVNSIRRQSELSDDLAPLIDETCKTVQDVIDMSKETLQKEADISAQQELYYNAVEKVLEGSEIEAADEAVRYTTNNYIKNYAASVGLYGIDFGTLLSYYGSSYEDFVDSCRESSIDTVKQRVALQEIARLENLQVTEEEKSRFAENYGYSLEDIVKTVDADLFEELVLEDMANRFIVENAKVTYVKAEEQ